MHNSRFLPKISCEPPGDSLGAPASQGRIDEGVGPYVVCRRTDCDRRDPSERVKPVYPLVRNGICYATAPQERYRAIPNGLAIPDRLAHALAVGPADHALPAGAPGAQGHCSLASVPIPSGAQQPIDSRPACARIGCRLCRPRIARRGSRGARALFVGFCADIERYPKA